MQSRMRTLALNLNAYGGSLQSLVLQKNSSGRAPVARPARAGGQCINGRVDIASPQRIFGTAPALQQRRGRVVEGPPAGLAATVQPC